MKFLEAFKTALASLKANKLRAALTLLGIAIGVFSIIGVMTAIGVLRQSIEGSMSQLGSNTFQIQKYPAMQHGPGDREKYRNRKDLTYEHGSEIEQKSKYAKNVGIEAWRWGQSMKWRNVETDPNVMVAGENPAGMQTNHWIIDRGRSITQQDIDLVRRVVILGDAVVKKLFPPQIDPIGKEIRIGNDEFTIIGTIELQGGQLGGNQGRYVVIPLSTFFQKFGKNRSIHIMVEAQSRETFEVCQDEVIGILRAARKVPPGKENDFEMFSNESVINQFNEITSSVRIGAFAISGIALLAAGIGIMNIMLVSVTERTREIGIRKAVGALKKNIIAQFISEAIVISLVGGVFGIILGLIGGNVLAYFLELEGVIPVDWIVFGLVACSSVGVIFGTYPAWKASNLDPIEALRYE